MVAPRSLAIALCLMAASCASPEPDRRTSALAFDGFITGELLPTGQRITPTAAAGAVFRSLNPNLAELPDYTAGQAVELQVSPDGSTMLVLTSGYNVIYGPDAKPRRALSNEYVFVYDIAGKEPVKRQVLPVPNSYSGLAWRPDGAGFFVSGGVDDVVHVFKRDGAGFRADGPPIPLGHKSGNGIAVQPMVAGLAVDPAGRRLIVANFQNDSVSLIDLIGGRVVAERDLRPGKIDPAKAGEPGGTYPVAVAWASDRLAYVSSQRDRELLLLAVGLDGIEVVKRIKLAGQPTKMILSKDRRRLFVAADNSDTVVAIDANDGDILAEIPTAAPPSVFANPGGLKGASPNSLALSPDERTLFATNGGLNAVAVIQLGRDVVAGDGDDGAPVGANGGAADDDDDKRLPAKSRVIGLIPTGWYPNAVALVRGGSNLYVVNGKSNAGPNPQGCRDVLSTAPDALNPCRSQNEYVWQLSKAGLLSLPLPKPAELARLTLQVAANDNYLPVAQRRRNDEMMSFLRQRIRHVVYIVKENRTYDQVLGDLEIGNGDPSLTLFPEPITPNHHALARRFVTLDNFLDSGETSNTGWLWTTAARTTDYTEKAGPVNYAGRGLQYDQEGDNRNINVGLATPSARQNANPATPADPDLVAGTADVAAPDPASESGGAAGTGYLWDAALRAGLSLRNYGFYGDLSRYFAKDATVIPPIREPFTESKQVFFATKASLIPHTDIHYRGYDLAYPDFYRVREWQREFALQVAKKAMPRLTLLRLANDHFGQFGTAIDGVNTVETQMADNDYAVGRVVETIAASPFAADTLIFIVEDDAQNGADHVDAHRSIAFIVGPYVKQGALVSRSYNTVNMLRTMEDVLGLPPLGLNDGLAEPMTEVFDPKLERWTYAALLPRILRTTKLPLGPATQAELAETGGTCFATPRRSAAWWEEAMAGQDFREEDRLDTARFNAALWRGLKSGPEPGRSNADLSVGRDLLLAAWRRQEGCE
ncbi:MAG: hypothetical protein HYR63_11130 [Proteobacteria bacterium]|nr:hypothetical protein [Pseudomonadota bacterium]MBI3498225.1 hypothetical protein [Pseudomonadota bacterium]